MVFERNTAKPGDPPKVEPYATTPSGLPYPLRSWVPDVAIDIQNLATAVDSSKSMRPVFRRMRWNAYGSMAGGITAILGAPSSTNQSTDTSLAYDPATGDLTFGTAGLYVFTLFAEVIPPITYMSAWVSDTNAADPNDYFAGTSTGASDAEWPNSNAAMVDLLAAGEKRRMYMILSATATLGMVAASIVRVGGV